jgi:DNA modification methylase
VKKLPKLIWNTEKRSVKNLVPFEYNPRTITDEDRAQLTESLERFNLVEIPAINVDNTILAGHQRISILLDLGRGDEEIDVRVPNRKLTEEEVREYNVRSNLNTGDWDFELLKEHYDSEELISWGFTKDELSDFEIDESETVLEEPEAQIERADELQAKWKTEAGQIWKAGHGIVVCGDSNDPKVIQSLLGRKTVNMTFSDPPYNVDYGANKHHPNWHVRKIEGDKQTPNEWEAFIKNLGETLKSRCEGDCYLWGASGPDGMRMRLWLIEMGFHWSATIIWKKQQLVLSPANYQRMYEPCLYGWFGKKSSFVGDRKQVEVWEVDRPQSSPEHPTMKPVKLAQIALANSSHPGDSVLDLFLGSGTTLVAAEQMKRVCYGVEIDPRYVAVTLERMSELKVKIDLIGTVENGKASKRPVNSPAA